MGDVDWIVRVKSRGNPVEKAHIFVVAESEIVKSRINWNLLLEEGTSPTHEHTGNGRYAPTGPLGDLTGNYRLIVIAEGMSPVIQPIKIVAAANGRGYVTSARNLEEPKLPGRELATIEIKTVSHGGSTTTSISVKMYPKRELVLMSGTQYQRAGGPKRALRHFCEARRDDLFAAKRIDAGTAVTLFSCDDRKVMVYFKAKGGGWVLAHQHERAPLPGGAKIQPGTRWPEEVEVNAKLRPSALHIEDLYEYLSWVGENEPGRVYEVSILSHAFRDGPILYNTFEHPRIAVEHQPLERDPNDFDGRPRDFDRKNLASYPHLPKAFGGNATWHVWGCFDNPLLVRLSSAAIKSRAQWPKDDTRYFDVDETIDDTRFIACMNRKRVLQRHCKWLASEAHDDERSYSGRLCTAIRRSVIAALPGTWSQFTSHDSMVVVDDTSFKAIESYHRSEPMLANRLHFKHGVDGERYVDYRKYRGIAVKVPPSIEQFELEVREFEKNKHACSMRLHGNIHFRHVDVRFKSLETTAIADVGALVDCPKGLVGKPGVLRIIHADPVPPAIGQPGPADSAAAAVLVVLDGKVRVFRMERASDGSFSRFKAKGELEKPARAPAD